MQRTLFVVAGVLLCAGSSVDAQLRPIDPPRSCRGASATAATADTTIDVGEKPPSWLRAVSSGGPRYPEEQRNARMNGEVRVSFVIDQTGTLVQGTAEVTAESHRAFGSSVCEFLRRVKFQPVVLAGQPRSVRVTNQRFLFEIH
ncbi:MAG: TonB family protein [Gemmatimonadaceae bacterium]|nr:TonB family protein [Gemmatimonadaceae bacterium]